MCFYYGCISIHLFWFFHCCRFDGIHASRSLSQLAHIVLYIDAIIISIIAEVKSICMLFHVCS